MLLPALGNAREKARQASCLSNLKQLALAMLMYVDDWGGNFPNMAIPLPAGDPPGNDPTWSVEAIFPYVGNDKVYICPSHRTGNVGTWQTDGSTWKTNPPVPRNSYGMNVTVGWNEGAPSFTWTYIGRSINKLADPAGTFLIGEVILGKPECNWWWLENFPALRHSGGANVAYCDGHVKWLRAAQLLVLPDGSLNNNKFWGME